MKRNNFLKSVFALPFIAPLLGKAKNIPEGHVLAVNRANRGNKGIHCVYPLTPKECHIWKEEDIKEGILLISQASVFQIVKCHQYRFEGDDRYAIHSIDKGIVYYAENYKSRIKLATQLNNNKIKPATKAEVIEMIMKSDKNFI